MVTEITAPETRPLRQKLLRQGVPIEKLVYPGDEDPGAFHLGLDDDGTLVGIVSFHLAEPPLPLPATGPHWRFRGMAVEEHLRGEGWGRVLMEAGVERLREQNAGTTWCTARTYAAGFYSKLGMQVIGEEFDIPDVGPHYYMWLSV